MAVIDDISQTLKDIQQIPVVPNLLEVLCQTAGMEFAAIVCFSKDQWINCSSTGSTEFGQKSGEEFKSLSLIFSAIGGDNETIIIENLSEDARFKSNSASKIANVESLISTPLFDKDRNVYGILFASDRNPKKIYLPQITGILSLFSELITFHLTAVREDKHGQSAQFLMSVLNSTHVGIASYDAIRDTKNKIKDFAVTYSNVEVPKNFGLKPENIIGKKCSEVYPGIFENGIFEKMVRAIETGKPEKYEIDIDQNGKILWMEAVIEKVDDFITVTSKNITSEKQAAVHLEEMRLEMERNIKELESFNHIASHDLQEPLRKIQLFYSRIVDMDKKNLSPSSLAHFENINNAAERMQRLIQALLSYATANTTGLVFENTDLNKLVSEVKIDLSDVIAEKNVLIESEKLPKISVIPLQFEQVLLNIISNGIKYSKTDEQPVITITTSDEDIDGKKFLKINIADNGIGFEQQYEQKIFKLFQRLHGKNEYAGTGIGLAICQKIVDNHKGFIKVKSEVGKGSIFSIYLPLKN